MSGNKPSPTAGWLLDLLWFTQDAFESSPWPGLVSGDLLFARWRSHPLGNSWRRMHLMYLLGLFAPIQVDVPEFSEVKNPLTPAVAPPTPSANQPPVTRRKWSLFGGYGRIPNCSDNQGWIGQRLTLSDFTASKLVSFQINSTLQEVRPSRLAPLFLDGLDGSRLLNLTSPHDYW